MYQIEYYEMPNLSSWYRNIIIYGCVTWSWASIFWIWAIMNMVLGARAFDLGIVSFLTVMGSSTWLLVHAIFRWKREQSSFVNEKHQSRRAVARSVVTTQAFVGLNYLTGLVLALHSDPPMIGFAIYCGIFLILWSISIFICWHLLVTTFAHVQDLGTIPVKNKSSPSYGTHDR